MAVPYIVSILIFLIGCKPQIESNYNNMEVKCGLKQKLNPTEVLIEVFYKNGERPHFGELSIGNNFLNKNEEISFTPNGCLRTSKKFLGGNPEVIITSNERGEAFKGSINLEKIELEKVHKLNNNEIETIRFMFSNYCKNQNGYVRKGNDLNLDKDYIELKKDLLTRFGGSNYQKYDNVDFTIAPKPINLQSNKILYSSSDFNENEDLVFQFNFWDIFGSTLAKIDCDLKYRMSEPYIGRANSYPLGRKEIFDVGINNILVNKRLYLVVNHDIDLKEVLYKINTFNGTTNENVLPYKEGREENTFELASLFIPNDVISINLKLTDLAGISKDITLPINKKFYQRIDYEHSYISGFDVTKSGEFFAITDDNQGKVFKVLSKENGIIIENHFSLIHDDHIAGLRFSPDENLLATYSSKGAVKIHNMQKKQVFNDLVKDHDKFVTWAEFSNRINGGPIYFASAGRDNWVRVYNLDKEELPYSPIKFENPKQVSFSSDLKFFMVLSESKNGEDSYLKIYDLLSGEERATKTFNKGKIGVTKFSSDNKFIFSQIDNNSLYVINVMDGVIDASKTFDKQIKDFDFINNSNKLALGFLNGMVKTVEFKDSNFVNECNLLSYRNSIKNIRFIEQDKILLSSSYDGLVKVFDLENNKMLDEVKFGENSGDIYLKKIKERYLIFSLARGLEIVEIDLFNGRLKELPFKYGIKKFEISSDGNNILAIPKKSTDSELFELKVYDLKSRRELEGASDFSKLEINDAAFSPDGKYLVTGVQEEKSPIFTINNGKVFPYEYSIKHQNIQMLSISEKGDLVITASDRTVEIHNILTKEKVYSPNLVGITHDIEFVKISSDSRYFIVKSKKQLWIFDLVKKTEPVILDIEDTSYPIFSPKENFLFLPNSEEKGVGGIYDLDKKRFINEIKESLFGKFSSSGKFLAISKTNPPMLEVYKLKNDAWVSINLSEEFDSEFYILDLDFSPDEKYVAFGSAGKRFTLLKTDGDLIFSREHNDWVSKVSFSSTGKHLLTGSKDGEFRVYDLTINPPRLIYTNQSSDGSGLSDFGFLESIISFAGNKPYLVGNFSKFLGIVEIPFFTDSFYQGNEEF